MLLATPAQALQPMNQLCNVQEGLRLQQLVLLLMLHDSLLLEVQGAGVHVAASDGKAEGADCGTQRGAADRVQHASREVYRCNSLGSSREQRY